MLHGSGRIGLPLAAIIAPNHATICAEHSVTERRCFVTLVCVRLEAQAAKKESVMDIGMNFCPTLVSIKEACRRLGVGRTTFYSRVRPELVMVPIGSRQLILAKSLHD